MTREQALERVLEAVTYSEPDRCSLPPTYEDQALARRIIDALGIGEMIEALDWAKAPTSDAHLDSIDRQLGESPGGYSLAGRVRALYSRERIDANRQRSRALRAEVAARDFARAIAQLAGNPYELGAGGRRQLASDVLAKHPAFKVPDV